MIALAAFRTRSSFALPLRMRMLEWPAPCLHFKPMRTERGNPLAESFGSFDDVTRMRLRRRLLARGQTLATLLADVLAGHDKSIALEALGLLRPGIRPEEALRMALDQVERRRVLLDTGDDRYGRCDVCGKDLGLAALDDMAWADRCAAHAAE